MITKVSRCLSLHAFSTGNKVAGLMLFASAPVGYPLLRTLHQYAPELTVVTHYTKPGSKITNSVETYCKQNSIPCMVPVKKDNTKEERLQDWQNFIAEFKQLKVKPALGVLCSYGYMIPENVIELFPRGMVLAHPSLIPKYRGGSPIFHAIANGETQSGVSFMEVSKNAFDHGNLLYQVEHPLGEKDPYEKVQRQLSQLIAKQAIHVIENIDSLRPGRRQSQMDVSGIPAHQLEAKIHREKDLNVNMPAESVYNWSRALIHPRVKFPNTQINPDIIVAFDKVFAEDPDNQFKPGQLVMRGKHLYMKCSDKLLKVVAWQEPSKRELKIHTFIDRFIDKKTYKNDYFFK